MGVGRGPDTFAVLFNWVDLHTFTNFKCCVLIDKYFMFISWWSFISHYLLTLVFSISFSNTKLFLDLPYILCFFLPLGHCSNYSIKNALPYLCLFHSYLSFKIWHRHPVRSLLSYFSAPMAPSSFLHFGILEFYGKIAKMVVPALSIAHGT